MPAVSQQQQKLFGLALAVKRGEVARSEASDEVLNIVDSMSEKDIEDFASTSHEGLPKQVEARLRETLRELMREMAIQEAELPAAPIPSGIKTKLVQAIEKIKDTNLNYNQKLQVIGRVIDSLGVDKKELAKMSSKLKTTLESINEADPCWKGYQQIGMKKKNGKEVPNCVPESVNEAVDIKDGKYRFYSKDGVGYLTYDGKELASGDFDWEDGSNSYWMSHSSFKGSQKAFDTGKDVINYFKSKKITTESVNEGSHGMATKLLQSIINGDSSRAEGIKMSKELAQHFMNWIKTSPFGKKYSNLPLDMLVKASFNWGIERGLDSKLKGELSKLKSTIKESVNEVASRTAMEIGGLTGMNKDAIQKFVDEHNLDIEKVFQFVKKGKLSDRMDFMTAVVGKPGNPIQKKMIKMFGESVNEAFSDNKNLNYIMKGRKVTNVAYDSDFGFAVILDNGKYVLFNTHSARPGQSKDMQFESVKEGKKRFNQKNNVGSSKYVISYHDGQKKHKDGSDFFDIQIFKNQKDLETFKKALLSKGFVEESVVTEEKYKLAVEKFNKELINHPMVKKAAQFYKKSPAEIVKVLQQRLYTKGDKGGETKEVWIDFKDTTSGIEIKHKMKFNESTESHDCGCGCGGVTEGGCGTTIKEDFKSVVGKTVFSDGKGKAFFGYYKEDDSAYFVDYKTWAKLDMKDVSKGDTNKDKVVNAILRNQKQFNKKVDYNMWAKKTNPSFEQKMDYFMKNGFVSNITKAGIKVD